MESTMSRQLQKAIKTKPPNGYCFIRTPAQTSLVAMAGQQDYSIELFDQPLSSDLTILCSLSWKNVDWEPASQWRWLHICYLWLFYQQDELFFEQLDISFHEKN